MRGKFLPGLLLSTSLAALALMGCQQQINYPAPRASSLSPSQIQAGQPAFTLTVVGGNFTPASAVEWNGSARVTFFTDTGHLTAQILASDIQNAGQASVTVQTPQPGGGISQPPLTFTVNPGPSLAPQVSSLSPSSVLAGSGSFIVVITGTNFFSQSVVTVNGDDRPVSFINSTTLQVAILASDVSAAGFVPLTVINPPPAGGTSSVVNLSVLNAVPGLASLTPTSVQAGAGSTAVTITGTGFVANSQVLINGSPRTTAFSSATSIQVTLTASDVAQGAVDRVQVSNPTPGGGASNAVVFAVTPTDTAGLPVLVDAAPDGTQANNAICGGCVNTTPSLTTAGPSASSTGEFVAFASNSTNLLSLTAPTAGVSEIFERHTCLGVSSCVPGTFLESVAINGGSPDGNSTEPSLDGTGAHAAFTSTADNLVNYVPVSGGRRQVYWTVTCTVAAGCAASTTTSATATTALVSISADGTAAGNGDSFNPVISSDGAFVAFTSLATNLVSNIPPGALDGVTPQVYLRNTCNGVTPQTQVASGCIPVTYLVSSVDGLTPGNAASGSPSVSTGGTFVSFVSQASNLGATAPSSPQGFQQVYEQQECLAVTTCTLVTTLVSTPGAGGVPANGASSQDSISPEGRFVAFVSAASNLGAASPFQQVYVRDTCNGATSTTPACTPSTTLVSSPDAATSPSTPANQVAEHPSISSCSTSTTTTTTTTSCTAGEIVAFASTATNLGSNVQNGAENIFVRNTCLGLATATTGCTPRMSLASQPPGSGAAPANGSSTIPSLTGDGHAVAFLSAAGNLVSGDNNNLDDIFVGATSF